SSVFRRALVHRNVPFLCRRGDHQVAHRGAGAPQRHEVFHGAAATAGTHVCVNIWTRLRLLDTHRVEIYFGLFSEKHRQACLDALSHLRLRHDEGNLSVGLHLDVSVKRVHRWLLGTFFVLLREGLYGGEPYSDHQAYSGDRSLRYECSAVDRHGWAPSPAAR